MGMNILKSSLHIMFGYNSDDSKTWKTKLEACIVCILHGGAKSKCISEGDVGSVIGNRQIQWWPKVFGHLDFSH